MTMIACEISGIAGFSGNPPKTKLPGWKLVDQERAAIGGKAKKCFDERGATLGRQNPLRPNCTNSASWITKIATTFS
ncbi:hypothetical protein [Bremerella cremea]|uniref:hypothetical protein n=1 Tax=Bremerella cremea TaxID=1031537 RepID=UPI0031E99DD9